MKDEDCFKEEVHNCFEDIVSFLYNDTYEAGIALNGLVNTICHICLRDLNLKPEIFKDIMQRTVKEYCLKYQREFRNYRVQS